MSTGAIIKRVSKSGKTSYLVKYDLPRDPATNKRRQAYKTVRGTKAEAAAELRRLLALVDRGEYVDASKMTVGQWIDKWLVDYAPLGRSQKTFERYAELLRLHVKPTFGATPVQKITATQVDELYTKLRATLAERTILHVHRVFGLSLKDAARKQVISRSPMANVTTPSPTKVEAGTDDVKEQIHALDQAKLDTLLRHFRGSSLFRMVALDAATGLRQGELLALRWSDIDFDRCRIRVERSVEDTKEYGLRFKAPKNKTSRRTIAIDAGTAAMLNAYRLEAAETALAFGVRLPDDALLFPDRADRFYAPRRGRNVTKEFTRIVGKLGREFDGFRFHDIRHTHATLLLTNGVPITAVSQRLGHASPTITLGVYAHLVPQAEEKAVEVCASFIAHYVNG